MEIDTGTSLPGTNQLAASVSHFRVNSQVVSRVVSRVVLGRPLPQEYRNGRILTGGAFKRQLLWERVAKEPTLSAGGVADEWLAQMLRKGDAQVLKKHSQIKLQMKREGLQKINRQASEMPTPVAPALCTVAVQ